MELRIDGKRIIPAPDERLLDLIRKLGLDRETLPGRPLAAKLAGEVFNLNYVPLRSKDITSDRPSIRRAMAASGGEVRLLRYSDPTGREVYTRTAQFVLFLALEQLWPQARAKMNCTLGPALYIQVENAPDFSAEVLKNRVRELVEAKIPLLRKRITTAEAVQWFTEKGRADKARLLHYRQAKYFDVYGYGSFMDYYYGELAPDTSYLQYWDILGAEGGFLFLHPEDPSGDRVGSYTAMPNFFSVFSEGERWGQLMECQTVADLNELVRSGRIRELIRVNEALHEKRYSQAADRICQRGVRAVMLAGPSSSGKTTSANRLGVQLRVHGKNPF